MEAANCQLSISQPAFIAAESISDDSSALVDPNTQKRQELEDILSTVWCRLDDHPSLLRSSHEMFRHDVNRALHDHLRPLLDAVCERTVAFDLRLQPR